MRTRYKEFQVDINLVVTAQDIISEASDRGYSLSLVQANDFLSEYGDSIESGMRDDLWSRVGDYLDDKIEAGDYDDNDEESEDEDGE